MYFERIKNIREDNDLTQKEIAQILGISRANYSAMENGRISFSLLNISKIADYYNISIDYLLGLTNTKRYTINNNELNLNDFGKSLRKARRKLRLTQENIAFDLGVTQPTYANYEKGKTIISVNRLFILSKKYNLSFDQLLGKTPNND
ncbi:MAG: helix-turn-helix transcriptional regulator [Bacilli bacterium]|nr:helix-turn-helix transcriptional regulator [Bacilli bacterium]MDD4283233.1 helix-turn-helix transcriptional regulator [Bacilli bacterium]